MGKNVFVTPLNSLFRKLDEPATGISVYISYIIFTQEVAHNFMSFGHATKVHCAMTAQRFSLIY